MEEYLRKLDIFRLYNPKYNYIYHFIEDYILGRINIYELRQNIEEDNWDEILILINRIINYKENEIKYYIELPYKLDFSTIGMKSIICSKILNFGIFYDTLDIIGPEEVLKESRTLNDTRYIEIIGNFRRLKNGIVLSKYDYVRIFLKYKYLYDIMYFNANNDIESLLYNSESVSMTIVKEEVNFYIEEILNKSIIFSKDWYTDELSTPLTNEEIDSIKFISKSPNFEIEKYPFFSDLVKPKLKLIK